MTTRILFCQNPLNKWKVDPDYCAEAVASHGYSLINYEALIAGDTTSAVEHVTRSNGCDQAIYRGWMLNPARYGHLYTALLERGLRLINSPAQYEAAHYLPGYHNAIAGFSPTSIWFKFKPGESDLDQILSQVSATFGDEPVVVRDYAKSAKHYWHEACFVPVASDRIQLAGVVQRFVELRGVDLAGGLVFRKFVNLWPSGQDIAGGLPAGMEYRLWFLDGKLMNTQPYWPGMATPTLSVEAEFPQAIEAAQRINSRFFTMDIAFTLDKQWIIIECGDGQVSGLQGVDPGHFYNQLNQLLSV